MIWMLVGWLSGCSLWQPAPTYEVVRGDTLGKIAARYDVTVDDLRTANGITGDLIEVGQVLRIPGGTQLESPDPPPAKAQARGRKTTARSTPSETPTARSHGLSKPRPERCLKGPEGSAGDHDMAASVGLTSAVARAAVDAVLPHTSHCITGEVPRGSLMVELSVACTGVVQRARVVQDAGWPSEVAACVTDVLTYADFPAHDLPDGETFVQPVTFAP